VTPVRGSKILLALAAVAAVALGGGPAGAETASPSDAAIVTVYPVQDPHGLMVTSGGWAYCLQVQALAKNSGYSLACGTYPQDGYTGYGKRDDRHLDWGDPAYLAALAAKVQALHAKVGGELVLIGVSYSGFDVATLASHHPELRPNRLIVIDSFLDLVERRAALRPNELTAREIDAETGDSDTELRSRSVSVDGLARLARGGTSVVDVWSVSADEQREFRGATCNRDANAGELAALATALGRPVVGWVTQSRHGHDLWDFGRQLVAGDPPGRAVTFSPHEPPPPGSFCA
jgi:pimeloyl-ACP methyl ester carboxylesterase